MATSSSSTDDVRSSAWQQLLRRRRHRRYPCRHERCREKTGRAFDVRPPPGRLAHLVASRDVLPREERSVVAPGGSRQSRLATRASGRAAIRSACPTPSGWHGAPGACPAAHMFSDLERRATGSRSSVGPRVTRSAILWVGIDDTKPAVSLNRTQSVPLLSTAHQYR